MPDPTPMSEKEGESAVVEKDQFRFLKRLPWEKITIWAFFLLTLYLLRSFFTIIFLTFIISYISWNLVSYLVRRLKLEDPSGIWRRAITVVVFLFFLAGIVGAGRLVIPKIVEQGNLLVSQVQILIPSPRTEVSDAEHAEALIANLVEKKDLKALRGTPAYDEYRKALTGMIRKVRLHDKTDVEEGGKDRVAPPDPPVTNHKPKTVGRKDLRYHFETFLEKTMGEEEFAKFKETPEYSDTYATLASSLQGLITKNIPSFVELFRSTLAQIVKYVLDFLVSVLFSFMMVFSLPSISRKLPEALQGSKMKHFYKEIAPSIVGFSRSMGRAFQGQAIIALCNTALTLVGMEILGIPNAAVLSVIVFVCSFIPVLGVFISSIPICLMAIQADGIVLALEAAVLITIIHVVEAYFLNPRILGSVMKMHPLLILVLLFSFEHFFGVWGLLLAVPAFHYIFFHVIMGKNVRGEKKPSDLLAPLKEPEPPPPQAATDA